MDLANINAAEIGAIVSTIDPQTVANSEKIGDYVDMGLYEQVNFYFLLGDMAAETIDCRVQEATDSSGTSAKAIKSAAQLASHASNNDNKQIVISIRNEDLDNTNSFRWVAPRMITGGGSGGPAACVGIAFGARSEPASDSDLSTVVEIETDHD